ncbi:MAG: nucleotidyl transferase AbiEii/AbiGii toxin family protein [Steroidobacteraceae bacterium]
MRQLQPTAPKSLNPYASELLEALAGHPEAAEIVLGGGVALSHYVDYRRTVDLDAWWRGAVSPEARHLAIEATKAVAERHGLQVRLRKWGETESFELLQAGRKVFSFQISTRTRYIEAPLIASWAPVMIESLRDNAASKMTALVERGAPRDLLDIHELCARGILEVDECWQLWAEKNADSDPQEGRDKVLFHVQRLELQRPLEKIQSSEDRTRAAAVRRWFKESFCEANAP